MDEQEPLLKIIHRRGKIPIVLLLSVLPFVYAYVNFEARAFGPFGAVLIVSVIFSGLMALFSLVSACMKTRLETPYERLALHRAKLAGILFMLGLAHAFALPFLVAALWQTFHLGSDAFVAAIPLLWCALVGAFILLYRLFRPYLLDSEGRMVSDAVVKANVDPHSHWRWWGYYNPDDPAVIVDRRPYGYGVTINWARRDNWAVMGYFGAFILVQVLVALLLGLLVDWLGRR